MNSFKFFSLSVSDKKALSFVIGAIIAGLSITYYNVNSFLAVVGVLVAVFFVVKAFE
ncbi:MAG: hypothetical protein AB1467_00815 [Candidatus Diapherotrites archaeon]